MNIFYGSTFTKIAIDLKKKNKLLLLKFQVFLKITFVDDNSKNCVNITFEQQIKEEEINR